MWRNTLLALGLVLGSTCSTSAMADWPGIYWWQQEKYDDTLRSCVKRAKKALDGEGFDGIRADEHDTPDVGSIWGHTDNEAAYIICRKVGDSVVATVVVSGDNNKHIKRYRDLLRDAM
jgi:hypothetical protein